MVLNVLTLPPMVASGLDKNFRLVLEKGEAQDLEAEYTSLWGKTSFLWTRIVPRYDSEMRQLGAIQILEDITERKKMEQALKQSEEKYRTLMENISLGVFRTTIAGKYLSVNSALARIYGFDSTDELMESPAPERYYAPGARESLLAALFEKKELKKQELEILRRDKSRIWVSLNCKLLLDESGRPSFIDGVVEDITERRKVEIELRKLSRATEESPASVVMTDLEGDMEYVNPKFTEVTGYTREEALGENPRILKSGFHGPEVYSNLWETIVTGGVWRGELLNRKKNSDLYWEFASISGVKDDSGHITHYVGVLEDITERKRSEEALKKELAINSATAKIAEILISSDAPPSGNNGNYPR